jgi:CheY-like chemotaxis protein
MNDVHFLVVEDDPDGQDLVARLLRHQRISYDVASTGEEAVSFLKQGIGYSAAVVDLALPGIDGWGVLEHIRNDPGYADIPVVAVTAYHSTELAVKAIEQGFTAYFPKPLEATSFIRQMQALING